MLYKNNHHQNFDMLSLCNDHFAWNFKVALFKGLESLAALISDVVMPTCKDENKQLR